MTIKTLMLAGLILGCTVAHAQEVQAPKKSIVVRITDAFYYMVGQVAQCITFKDRN